MKLILSITAGILLAFMIIVGVGGAFAVFVADHVIDEARASSDAIVKHAPAATVADAPAVTLEPSDATPAEPFDDAPPAREEVGSHWRTSTGCRIDRELATLLARRNSSVVSLEASSGRPNCTGAALMASDIAYDAEERLPAPLSNPYMAYAHGTNTAGDPRALYRCTISYNEDDTARRVISTCVTVAGDNFRYVFDLA